MRPNTDPTSAPARGGHRRLAMGVALAAFLAVTGALVTAQTQTAERPTTKPAPREGAWMDVHESFLKRARQGDVGLLFLGDSITQGWNREVWDRYYGARDAANFGIGGDRTQHVLWRLDHGEADGIKPKVAVLMIGTNNLGSDAPPEIAEGIAAIVEKLRSKLPETKVLLLGVFPRGFKPGDPSRDRIKAINARVARLDDGKSVRYLDIGRHFLEDDGSISPHVMPDALHLSRKGYRIWADAIEPTLWPLLEGAK